MLEGLNGRTVLVTGATGFIGRHLTRRLLTIPDIRLVLLSRRESEPDLAGATWVCSSLEGLRTSTWRRAGVTSADIVFHLGAFIPKTGDSVDRREEVYRDNLLGTRALLESLPASPTWIVFASTVDVYAPPKDNTLLDENAPLGPTSLYGASKLFCEQLTCAYAREQGCGVAILRYGHIYGPGEEAYHKLIPHTIRQLLQGESPVLYGDGSVRRDFLYVEDAVEATLRAVRSEQKELGPVNIVPGASLSIRDIVLQLIEISGFDGEIRFLPDRPNGVSLSFDNRRMRSVLGDWPLVSLEEGLRREWEYCRRPYATG